MKIGIMTFHWATNYGAVLQAFALQEACDKMGADTFIIDYYPRHYKKNILNSFLSTHLQVILSKIKEIPKEKQIEEFRRKYLKRTSYFNANIKLKNAVLPFECYICGSDQIWNESFSTYGEFKPTYSYFLDFAPDDKIIASYAASFGTDNLTSSLRVNIKKLLNRFDFISVRENSGAKIINDLGFDNVFVVPDPTLLLEKGEYEKFVTPKTNKFPRAFVYMLHNQISNADNILKILSYRNYESIICDNIGVEEWLSQIYNSDIIVTNSFHGTVFSIIFQKPFIAIPVNGSRMNNRIETLLGKLGLQNRIFQGNLDILETPIDWQDVEKRLNKYRAEGYNFLNKVIHFEKDE